MCGLGCSGLLGGSKLVLLIYLPYAFLRRFIQYRSFLGLPANRGHVVELPNG